MLPTLRPGDRLRVDRNAYRTAPPQAGDLVVAIDPQEPSRWLVKRVAEVLPAGPGERTPRVVLRSDNPARGRDSRVFGPVGLDRLVGRVYRRYAPAGRRGAL